MASGVVTPRTWDSCVHHCTVWAHSQGQSHQLVPPVGSAGSAVGAPVGRFSQLSPMLPIQASPESSTASAESAVILPTACAAFPPLPVSGACWCPGHLFMRSLEACCPPHRENMVLKHAGDAIPALASQAQAPAGKVSSPSA